MKRLEKLFEKEILTFEELETIEQSQAIFYYLLDLSLQ